MGKRSRPEDGEGSSEGQVMLQQADLYDDQTAKNLASTIYRTAGTEQPSTKCRPLSRVPSNPSICSCSPVCTHPLKCKVKLYSKEVIPFDAASGEALEEAARSRWPVASASSPAGTDPSLFLRVGLPHLPESLIELHPKLKSFVSAVNNVEAGTTPFIARSTGDSSSTCGAFPWLGGHAWLALAKSMKTESMHPPVGSSFMKDQVNITVEMRRILVDWLLEFWLEVGLGASASGRTFELAVQILDRYLSAMRAPIARSQFQLAGYTALMIANKYDEEAGPMCGADAAFIACTREEGRAMERDMLTTLDHFLGYSVPEDFLEYYIPVRPLCCDVPHRPDVQMRERYTNTIACDMTQASGVLSRVSPQSQLQFRPLCQLYCDIALLDLDIHANFQPSAIAATAVLLAQRKLGVEEWSPILAGLSGYTEDDLQNCAESVAHSAADPELVTPIIALKYTRPSFFNAISLI